MNFQISLDWNWQALRDAFEDNTRQYITIDSGRGTGKTRGLALWFIDELLTTDAQHALWVDTVQNNIDAYVDEHFKNNILKEIWQLCEYNIKRKRLTLPNGKFLQFASAERPELIEGFRYHRIGLNEAGIILRKASLWDNTLEPMTHTKDGIENKTRIVGTMKGKNKFHTLTRLSDPDWKNYHFSIYDCPQYTLDEIERIKRTKPALVWQQEYMSEVVDKAGSVFTNIEACIREVISTTEADIMAIDLAKYQDYTVIILGNSKTHEAVHIERFNKLDWTNQKKKIVALWQRYNKPKTLIDSTGVGDPIFDDLKRFGMNISGYKFTTESKKDLIENLAIALESGNIFFPNYEPLINELEVFEYTVSRAGNIVLSAPEGLHDDCVIALGLLNFLNKGSIDISLSWV